MTSKPIVLDDMHFSPDEAGILHALGPGAAESAEEIRLLICEAGRIARPKAVYRPCDVEESEGDRVVIGGVAFESSLLAMNLGGPSSLDRSPGSQAARRVFPFVVTCGTELARWAEGMQDPPARFWADGISEQAMAHARDRLMDHLRKAHGLTRASTMNPGSLPEWPLSQQAPLFRLIGDTERLVGVRLTESFLMLPVKSVSGIRFPLEADYENCMLCPREPCKGRRAPFDPGMRARFTDAAPASALRSPKDPMDA